MVRARLIVAMIAGLVSVAGSAVASPPTDEQVTAAAKAFTERTKDLSTADRTAYANARREAAEAVLKDLDIGGMTVEQIAQLHAQQLFVMAAKGDEVGARLTELAKDDGVDGARAAVIRMNYLPWVDQNADAAAQAKAKETQREALRAAVGHPALATALKAGYCADVFSATRWAQGVAAEESSAILKLESALTPDLPAPAAMRVVNFVEFVLDDASKVPQGDRERIRAKAVAAIRGAMAGLTPEQKSEKSSLEKSEAFLSGAYARGELVGHAAPGLKITWSNSPTPLTSMADLKGKVVVLDFWATWCGPCIASFPNVRELKSHYEGYPVEIIGVTSLQGYHYDKARQRTDTKDDPAKEYQLMSEFIKAMDMTWTVAFTDEWVFNPDYGVRGIPHVAIIDPAGVVRYRGLHPGADAEGKLHKIDGLLKEFNLPAPAPADKEAPKTGG